MTYDQIVNHYGGVRAAARALNLSPASVHSWKEHGVPGLRQYQIDHATKGRLQVDQSLLPAYAFGGKDK